MKAPFGGWIPPTQVVNYLCIRGLLLVLLALLAPSHLRAAETKTTDAKAVPKVSYYRQVRPILQANCQGCHQPAKSKGGYVMTEFKRLLAGGDSEGSAIVPKHP